MIAPRRWGWTLLGLVGLAPLVLAVGVWQHVDEAPFVGGEGQAVVSTARGALIVRQWTAGSQAQAWLFVPHAREPWTALGLEGLPPAPFRPGTALAWDGNPNGYIYALLGGRAPLRGDPDRRAFYRYWLTEDRWERLADTPAPQGAGDALAYAEVEQEPRVYALLGSPAHVAGLRVDGSPIHGVFAFYETEADRWQTASFKLRWQEAGVGPGAALAWDGFDGLYAFQGSVDNPDSPFAVPSSQFARFNLLEKRWSGEKGLPELAPVPEAEPAQERCGIGPGASLLYQGNVLYALGGGCLDGRPGERAYRYSIAEDRWERLTDLPCPVGRYPGNRLFTYKTALYYWQGSPSSPAFRCGGEDLFRWTGSS